MIITGYPSSITESVSESYDLSTEDTFITKFKVGKCNLQFSHRKGTKLYQVSENDSYSTPNFPYAQTRDGGKTWIVRIGPKEIDTFKNITDYMEVAKKLVKIYEKGMNESADMTLQAGGSQIVLSKSGKGCIAYFYSSRGEVGEYLAKIAYQELYPKKVIDDVDTKSGFIEFKTDVKSTAKMLQDIFNYKVISK